MNNQIKKQKGKISKNSSFDECKKQIIELLKTMMSEKFLADNDIDQVESFFDLVCEEIGAQKEIIEHQKIIKMLRARNVSLFSCVENNGKTVAKKKEKKSKDSIRPIDISQKKRGRKPGQLPIADQMIQQ